jgi:hypothetical protein
LAARFVRDEEAAGSNPATPTQKSQVTARLCGLALRFTSRCVGVYLEPELYQRRNFDGGMLGLIQRLAPRSDLRENVRTFKAAVSDQETDRAEEIDLLRDELISRKKILRQHGRTRVLLSDDAYAKIVEAYTERHDDLAVAASVSVARD